MASIENRGWPSLPVGIVIPSVKSAEAVCLNVNLGRKIIQFKSNNVEGAELLATTDMYQKIYDPTIELGRFFSNSEYRYGSNKIIIGNHLV